MYRAYIFSKRSDLKQPFGELSNWTKHLWLSNFANENHRKRIFPSWKASFLRFHVTFQNVYPRNLVPVLDWYVLRIQSYLAFGCKGMIEIISNHSSAFKKQLSSILKIQGPFKIPLVFLYSSKILQSCKDQCERTPQRPEAERPFTRILTRHLEH